MIVPSGFTSTGTTKFLASHRIIEFTFLIEKLLQTGHHKIRNLSLRLHLGAEHRDSIIIYDRWHGSVTKRVDTNTGGGADARAVRVILLHGQRNDLARRNANGKQEFWLVLRRCGKSESNTPADMLWTRDELLIVINLYHKLRFGQFDQRQRVVIDLANRIGIPS